MLTAVQRKFLDRYRDEHSKYKDAARQSQDLIKAILSEKGLLVHTVEARAKKPDSLQWKIFEKNYERPSSSITDLIGVRVILFFDTDVELVEKALKDELKVIRSQSVDKRRLLGYREFGYRSLHLIVRLKGYRARAAELRDLAPISFEIQIRTVLDHAWAEIEHEIVYKSGIDYPRETRRRFASIAGSLELLGREFLALRTEKRRLIDQQREAFKQSFTPNLPLSVVGLCALLELDRPTASHFCDSTTLPAGIEEKCVTLLKRVKLKSVGQLRKALRTKPVTRALRKHAALHGFAANTVPDLSVILILLRLRNKSLVEAFFPEFDA